MKDLVVRTETTKLVKDLVDFDRVQSLLLMISHRRRYLAVREQKRLQKMHQQGSCAPNRYKVNETDSHLGVPAIIVESSPVTMTPPPTSRDITSPGQISYHHMDPESPTPRPATLHSPELTFSLESPSGSNLQRSRRISDASMLSTDIAVKSS